MEVWFRTRPEQNLENEGKIMNQEIKTTILKPDENTCIIYSNISGIYDDNARCKRDLFSTVKRFYGRKKFGWLYMLW